MLIAQREDPLLRARPFFVPTGAAERRVEAAGFERVEQGASLEQTAATLRADGERFRAVRDGGVFVCTINLAPIAAACQSRKVIISANLYVVSTWSSGNGIGPGWNAFCASRSSTDESLPIEYSMTGRWNSAATSRRMWMLSASSVRRCSSADTVPSDVFMTLTTTAGRGAVR